MKVMTVTGAWSYLGRHIARELLARGAHVNTLTRRRPPNPDPFQGAVEAMPLQWDQQALTQSLRNTDTLYNTYWVRHDQPPIGHRGPWTSHQEAVGNSGVLFRAAQAAGVRRVVHVSITQPSLNTSLSYFRGKAQVEEHLRQSGLPHAILRPTCYFGDDDILINNIAWAARRFPVFPLPRPLGYQLRPIHVADMARLVCDWGESSEVVTRDACGPEQYRFDDLVRFLGRTLTGREPRCMALPIPVCLRLYQMAGWALRDTILSLDELEGLASDLLSSDEPPQGTTALSEWVRARTDTLGRTFHPEPPR